MSFIDWKALAKSKSELGKKINLVRNAIMERDLSQNTTQESYQKIFRPVTDKLDDVVDIRKKTKIKLDKKGLQIEEDEPIDYAPEIDPLEDMDVENLIEPQIPILPPPHEDLEGPDYGTFTEVEDS